MGQMWRVEPIDNSLFGDITNEVGTLIQKNLFLDEADRIVAAHNRTLGEGLMSKWISVKDRLPEEGAVLCFLRNGAYMVQEVLCPGMLTGNVRCWMPISHPDLPDVGSVNVGGVKLPDAIDDIRDNMADLEQHIEARCDLLEHRFINHRHQYAEQFCDSQGLSGYPKTSAPIGDDDEE